MPKPREGERKEDFIPRCVSVVSKEHPEWSNDQVVAVCYNYWKEQESSIVSVEDKRYVEIYGEQKKRIG